MEVLRGAGCLGGYMCLVHRVRGAIEDQGKGSRVHSDLLRRTADTQGRWDG